MQHSDGVMLYYVAADTGTGMNNKGGQKHAHNNVKKMWKVNTLIGADGANNHIMKEIQASNCEYNIVLQKHMYIGDKKMEYYVSLDFYVWVFSKYNHIVVDTDTGMNNKGSKKYAEQW